MAISTLPQEMTIKQISVYISVLSVTESPIAWIVHGGNEHANSRRIEKLARNVGIRSQDSTDRSEFDANHQKPIYVPIVQYSRE